MAGCSPNTSELSLGIDWEFLFQQTVSFADYQINRLRWRGAPGGVLPEGFDAAPSPPRPSRISRQPLILFLSATVTGNRSPVPAFLFHKPLAGA